METTSFSYVRGTRKIKRCSQCQRKITGNNYLKLKLGGYFCITCSKMRDSEIVRRKKAIQIKDLETRKYRLEKELLTINELLFTIR